MEKAKLSVVVGTCNRKDQIKRCVESVFRETRSPVKVYVTDAGSTDGTVEYLRSLASEAFHPILAGNRVGQARAYNQVFEIIDTPYTCWLSEDNEVVNGGLDIALDILEKNSQFGMIGLKVKDVQGPFIHAPYIGGVSSLGILNVNQGVLPTALLKRLGGFSLEFRDYGIDPDLTARVLFLGYQIAYTKRISLYHHRNCSMDKKSEAYKELIENKKKSLALYEKKFAHCYCPKRRKKTIQESIKEILKKRFFTRMANDQRITRDLYNVVNGRYIHILDLILNAGKDYYLVQTPSKSKDA